MADTKSKFHKSSKHKHTRAQGSPDRWAKAGPENGSAQLTKKELKVFAGERRVPAKQQRKKLTWRGQKLVSKRTHATN